MSPLVSVIVPVYNVEEYLHRCIDSLINQSYLNLEIILVDDGSTDRSPSICDEYATKDSRIKVIHKKNGGLSSARNIAIDIMCGEYVVFVDSDDYVSCSMIEKFIDSSLRYKADVVVANYTIVGNYQTKAKAKEIEKDYCATGIDIAKAIIRDEYPKNFAWGKLYKSYLFNNMRFPEGRLYEDVPTIYKVVAKSNFVYCLSESLYFYEMGRPNNITSELTSTKAIKSYKDGMINCVERISFIEQHPEFQDMKPIVKEHICRWALLAMQVAAVVSLKCTVETLEMVKLRLSEAKIKPYTFALKLAFVSPLLYYWFEKFMKCVRRFK